VAEEATTRGLICIGKVATTEFSLGVRVPSRNPRYPDYSPSGSSTGSAVAVAAGFCDVSVGTDAAGSIRWPAANCGVVGLRLTPHGSLTSGTFPVAPSLESIGLVTRTVEDLAHVWSCHDLGRLWGSHSRRDTEPLRWAVATDWETASCDVEVRRAFDSCCDLLERNGIRLPRLSLDWWHAREDGFRLLLREAADVHAALPREIEYEPAVAATLAEGRLVTDHELVGLRQRRNAAIALAQAQLVEECDVVLLPLDPELPRRLEIPAPARAVPELGSLGSEVGFTIAASVAGLPAVTLPIGHSSLGAPIALQMFARPGGEEDLIRAALLIERVRGPIARSDEAAQQRAPSAAASR
jgi:Asp-tRNA(Asn)/Glu-tRNA(Gln) amidotransferase A subunit family amidase